MALETPSFTIFRLGPVGRMRNLPMVPVDAQFDMSLTRIGGEHVALTGALTLDTVGHKRTWGLSFRCLDADEIDFMRALYLRTVSGALRLIDPRERNRLSKAGSSGGSYQRTTAAHTTTAGTLSVVQPTDYPEPYVDRVDSAVALAVPATTVTTLRINSATHDRVPVVPGEPVTVSVLAKGTLGAQVGVQPYDITGAALSTSLASSVTLSTTWQRLTHTWTPGATAVSASLILQCASGAARTVTIGPAQYEPGSVLNDWVLGLGVPVVAIGDMPHHLAGVGALYGVDLALREM